MLVVLYCQKLLLPSISDLQETKYQFFKLKASVENFSESLMEKEKKNIDIQIKKIDKGFEMIQSLVPPFDGAMANIEAKFDYLKNSAISELVITKSPTFRYEEDLVRWHFKLSFIGAFKDAMEVIAKLEAQGQLVKIERLKITPDIGDKVKVETDLDLIFLNMSNGATL